jgi:hypothetical protein
MWKNLLHPTINRSAWKKDEDAMLMQLAKVVHKRHWDAVAEELGTGRTGFLCFIRHQQKTSSACDKRRWTPAEDDRLKQLVDKCRINHFIPWTKVGNVRYLF